MSECVSMKDAMFQQIYQEQYRKIYGYVYNHINNPEETEDLVQNIFVSCYKNLDSYTEEKSSIATWLFVITNNKLKNYYRDKKTAADIDEFSDILPDTGSDLEEQVIQVNHSREMVAKALQALPERNRKIVMMTYFDNMQSEEIAKRMGMSAGNVRIILMRSLKKMQTVVDKE